MDLDDMKRSLDCMKPNEIFELIEKAINIAASQHPKELLQQRDRIVNMLLNSHINTTHSTHDDEYALIYICFSYYICMYIHRYMHEFLIALNWTLCRKKIINDADSLWGDFPTIDELEHFLAEVESFDPAKVLILMF